MMAAVLAKGTTVISNAALEPEIVALGQFLMKMGGKIEGLGTSTLTIEGVDELVPRDFKNIPDRIEAGTFLVGGAMTGGTIEVIKLRAGTSLRAPLKTRGSRSCIGCLERFGET